MTFYETKKAIGLYKPPITITTQSKPLLIAESNDSKFVQDILHGDNLGGVAVANIININGKYIMFEFLLCEEAQSVNPHTSHPNRYWHKNKGKFLALHNIAKALNADLYLVNYAKPSTKYEDKVKLIKVTHADFSGITVQKQLNFTRNQFSRFYRFLNKKALSK